MPGRLQDKIAIVTGSTSGIGRAIALAFAKEGAKVVCSDLDEGEQEGSTRASILNDGGEAIFVKTNVTIGAEVESLVKEAVEKYGRLDIMVNNAGIAPEASKTLVPIWEAEEDVWDATMLVNSRGVFLGCKYAAAQMIKQEPLPDIGDRGWIVNIASLVGLVGGAGAVAYVSSKHACVGTTKAAALDLAPYRVHCNAIAPGWTETPMVQSIFKTKGDILRSLIPFRGFGCPEEIAKAAVFLASEDNTWMTGAIMSVDGGYTAQ
ncbi:putative short chain type dehydrogenase [Aulographum hederae CBS 113979]|uniref:Putative short chain type dehydrogenase n=1 Tax=Aulographum hederae CBS 113979 TaxID=1176131 RepID=A0A6G1HBS8_9PEZI|nr:putative short chain type dehydrogenase [Aulographum hederae CBS 113979]